MSGHSSAAEPELNATPLIDVLLVLMVILIITVPIATHATKLNLPQRTPGAPQPSPPVVRLDIVYGGDVYWNGERVASVAQLSPRFAVIARSATPALVYVVPERMAPYEKVAQVLAAAQRSHVTKLSLAPVAD